MPAYEHGHDGTVIMLCQVCKARCHGDDERQGHIKIGEDAAGRPQYKTVRCQRCMCHDCVQISDDPIRQTLKPHYLGQTSSNPFNLEAALGRIAGELGMTEPGRQRLGGPAGCTKCAKPAKTRCITCNEPLCGRHVGKHRCR